MGCILGVCAAQAACCCCGAACNFCCSCCPSSVSSIMTRLMYLVLIVIGILTSSVFLIPSVKETMSKSTGIPFYDKTFCEIAGVGKQCEKAIGFQSIYRVWFAYAMFFLLMALLTIGVKSSKDCRAMWHNGFEVMTQMTSIRCFAGIITFFALLLVTYMMKSMPYRKVFIPAIKPTVTYQSYLQPQCLTRAHQTLLSPCIESIAWSSKRYNISLRTDIKSTRYALKSYGNYYEIHIETYDASNRQKSIGGDSWWVKVVGDVSFHVPILDLMDGRYVGYFRVLEIGNFSLKIQLEYSLCDGIRDPPMLWFKAGDVQGTKQKKNVLGTHSDDIYALKIIPFVNLKTVENVKHLKMPSNNCHLNDECGYWKKKTFLRPTHGSVNPLKTTVKSKHATLMFYGDSTQKQLYNFLINDRLCTIYTCKRTYIWIYIKENRKLQKEKYFNSTKFINEIRGVLRQKEMQNADSVLFINFGLHFVRCLRIEEMKLALKMFLDVITQEKKQRPNNFPRIIWRTTTPTKLETMRGKITYLMFLTKQRVEVWRTYVEEELCKAGIPILSVYYTAASHPTGPYDNAHYKMTVFSTALQDLRAYLG